MYKNQIWYEKSRRRLNDLFQILSKSVNEFSSYEGKIGIFHWLLQSPLQQVSTTVTIGKTSVEAENSLWW